MSVFRYQTFCQRENNLGPTKQLKWSKNCEKKYDKRYQRFTDTVNQPLCPGVLVALIKETKIFFVEIKKNKQHNL